MRALSTVFVASLFVFTACGDDDNGPTPTSDSTIDAGVSMDFTVDMFAGDLTVDGSIPVTDLTVDSGAPVWDMTVDGSTTQDVHIFVDSSPVVDTGPAPDTGPGPANDQCSSAEVLTWSGSTITKQVDTSTANDDLDLTATGCTSFETPGYDVFFQILLPAGQYTITLTPDGALDPALYVMTGCQASDCVAGTDEVGGGTVEVIDLVVPVQTTYIIGVDSWEPAEFGTSTLEISSSGPTPDAGPPVDAGPAPDSGPVPDATPPADSGSGPAQIIITEMMINPTTPNDVGEWFELYNAGGTQANLNGWIIQDLGTNSHTISSDLFIAPGQYVVLGRTADTGTNGNVNLDYEYSSFQLANSDDEIQLMNGATVVDVVQYDEAAGWTIPNGSSLSLNPVTADNNVATNWCQETAPWASGDNGTPGSAAGCTP